MQGSIPRTKECLTSPLLRSKPITGETLFLYLVMSESAVSEALDCEDEDIQKLVYDVSRLLAGA